MSEEETSTSEISENEPYDLEDYLPEQVMELMGDFDAESIERRNKEKLRILASVGKKGARKRKYGGIFDEVLKALDRVVEVRRKSGRGVMAAITMTPATQTISSANRSEASTSHSSATLPGEILNLDAPSSGNSHERNSPIMEGKANERIKRRSSKNKSANGSRGGRPSTSSISNSASTSGSSSSAKKRNKRRSTSSTNKKKRVKKNNYSSGSNKNTKCKGKYDPNGTKYCICGYPSYGKMIGCDNENCPIEWYHFSCLKLKRTPSGDWYCPSCRSNDNVSLCEE